MAVTGGPGAGKTAILAVAERILCAHVQVLPEAATVLFSGGFPAGDGFSTRRAAQRAIFHVQAELEALGLANDELAAVLCNRGTLDGLAYWPGNPSDFFSETRTSAYEELARYHAVVHLRVGPAAGAEARAIDARLLEIWSAHPKRVVIEASDDFLVKIERTIHALRDAIGPHECAT